MAAIHPTAQVSAGAVLGAGVEIGPYCIVGDKVVLADGVRLHSHVVIAGATTIGEATQVHPFAVLGEPPIELLAEVGVKGVHGVEPPLRW